jgi:hypothetical protein
MSEWSKLPRFSKLSSCLYPHLVEPEIRAQMNKLAAGEKKQLRDPNLLSNETRGAVSPLGNVAKGWDKLRSK